MPKAKSFLRRVASAAPVRPGKMAIAVVLADLAVATVAVVLAAPEVLVVVVAVVLAAHVVTTLRLLPPPLLLPPRRPPPLSNLSLNSTF